MAEYKFVNTEQLEADLGKVGSAIRAKGGTTELLAFPEEMVSAIGAISTGVELNFDVVPGLTQPGTAAENTIWVKTESLTGWYFAATQPENMQEGEVWFQTGTGSAVEFNALKKNGIQVYPQSAKQLTGGVLVDVEAMSYQSGEWVNWITYLYNEGDECTYITGGWALSQNYNGSHGDSLTKNEDSMVFSTSFVMNVHNAHGFLRANNKIDLTGKNTIAADFESSANIAGPPLYLSIKETDTAVNNMKAYTQIKNGDVKVYLDISLYDGEYYVGIAAGNAEGSSSVAVEQVIIS